jgi:hypothetical protein
MEQSETDIAVDLGYGLMRLSPTKRIAAVNYANIYCSIEYNRLSRPRAIKHVSDIFGRQPIAKEILLSVSLEELSISAV